MTTLVASGEERASRAAARLGAFWGLGHALTLVLFGLPILLFQQFLPERVQQSAETAVAALIVFLALRLLVRWRHGYFNLHAHVHEDEHHEHAVRTPLGAFGIGLVHGMGGSAGVGVLILAAIPSTTVACVALVVLALFTAVSMTIVTTGFGLTLSSAPRRIGVQRGRAAARAWRASRSASGTRSPPGGSSPTRSSLRGIV